MMKLNSAQDPRFIVNLKNHHGQCEINFHLLMGLVPKCREASGEWRVAMASSLFSAVVSFQRIELSPYTTTLRITQESVRPSDDAQRERADAGFQALAKSESSYLLPPSLTVRLYHDVEMAEVVAWDNHRYWHPVYSYPNSRMYHRDEKLALNRFLGEWLVCCRKLGVSLQHFVNPLPD